MDSDPHFASTVGLPWTHYCCDAVKPKKKHVLFISLPHELLFQIGSLHRILCSNRLKCIESNYHRLVRLRVMLII